MTTDQITAALAVYDATLKAERENRIKLRAIGLDEGVLRMYEMHHSSVEWADSLRDELKRRDELDEVANLIYLNMFTTPTSSNIVPLKDHRNDWERDMIYRQAEAVVGYYRTKNEPLAQWEIDLLNSGKDEK